MKKNDKAKLREVIKMTEKGEKKKDENALMWEEPGVYWVRADKEKNRIELFFQGKLKKSEQLRNLPEHVRKAVAELKDGLQVLSSGHEIEGNPGFGITRPFMEGQKLIMAKKPSKIATTTTKLGHKMVVNVLTKLTGMTSKVFDTEEKAKAWLDKEE